MTRLDIPNGLYCDAWPSRAYACLMANRLSVQTHLGSIATPGIAPLYLRMAVDPFRFAGQGFPTENPKDNWIEWNGAWALGDRTAYGVSPCIYDRNGGLVIATPAQGSQGYRFVDETGRLWTGDDTYYSSAMGLSEWSGIGDGLFIGQSPDDAMDCLLWDGKAHRRIEPGQCRFIRVNRVGQDVSIAMVKMGGQPSVILWTTVAELLSLPIIDPLPIPPIDPFTHPVWVAPFFPNQACPGSACILANQQDYRVEAPTLPTQLVLTPSALAVATPPRDRTLAIYCETRDPLPFALRDELRLCLWVCQDNPLPYDRAVLAQFSTGDIPLLECYLLPSETVPQAASRWKANLQRLLADWKYRVGLVWQDYTQAWTVPIARLLEAHTYMSGLVNLSERVQVVAPFAWNRSDGCVGPPYTAPDGTVYYSSPQLAQCVRNIAAASPEIPTFIPCYISPDEIAALLSQSHR